MGWGTPGRWMGLGECHAGSSTVQGAELTPTRALPLLAMLAPGHPTGHSLATPCGHKPAPSWPKPTAPSHLGESSQAPFKHPAFGYVGQEGSASSVTFTTAPGSIPWMHSVLERIQRELGVPCKTQHHPSVVACLQSPRLLPAPAAWCIHAAPRLHPLQPPRVLPALALPHCVCLTVPLALSLLPGTKHQPGHLTPLGLPLPSPTLLLSFLSLCFPSVFSRVPHSITLSCCPDAFSADDSHPTPPLAPLGCLSGSPFPLLTALPTTRDYFSFFPLSCSFWLPGPVISFGVWEERRGEEGGVERQPLLGPSSE